MNKTVFFLLVLMLLLSPDIFGQGMRGKSFWRSLVKKTGAAERTAAAKAAFSAAEYGAVRQVLLRASRRAVYEQAPPYQTAGLPGKIFRSLVQVVNVSTGGLASGGFIFEEFARGKRTLWVAVPYHVAGGKGHPVTLRLLGKDGSAQLYSLNVAVGGGWGKNALDVSLVRLPEEVAEHVFALRLSDVPAKTGRKAAAYGYTFELDRLENPLVVPHTVRAVSGFRLSGDGPLPARPGGFCGAPLVAQSGYVLGMHCASESGESFSVSAEGIKEVLRSYYFGEAEYPVLVLGREVFRITSSESISRMTLNRSGEELIRVDVPAYSGPFSYERAEQAFGFLPIQPGDEIVFYVMQHGKVTRVIQYTAREGK